ncbi:MAG: L-threonylcarbamoyladenylate synthase [Qipengyuania sp.]
MGGKYATETILADAPGIARAAQILRDGGLVAVPTETVYGLAARADSDEAVARIYEAKGRPSFNPLIVHIASFEDFERFTDSTTPVASWNERAEPDVLSFARSQWPGPTTLVLQRRAGAPVSPMATAGLDSIALRMPNHRVARELISQTGPIAAPSANRSGFISPTRAAHVLASLDGKIDLVLDAGPTCLGVESTILKLQPDGRFEELRAGPEDTSLWHPSWFNQDSDERIGRMEAPGQLASHYAPGKPVRLMASLVAPDEFLIGFGAIAGECTLSARGDLTEAASRLYACLHEAAASHLPRIAVAPVPEQGVGIAINDRLRRAATPPG